MTKMRIVLVGIIAVIMLGSCSLTKRRYMDGYKVFKKDRAETEQGKVAKDTVAVKRDAVIVKKEKVKKEKVKRERLSFDRELNTWDFDIFVGLGNHTTFVYGGGVAYKGFGAYMDAAILSKAKYASSGIYYDVLRRIDRHSLELGVSFWGNYHGSYQYLFERRGDIYYVGVSAFHIPNSKFEEYEHTLEEPEKYQTTSKGFLPIQVVVGVRFLDEWPSWRN